MIATAFDHCDSRANDPHLHTHIVISNRVKTTRDGAWRTIDGNPLHAWVVAISELHEAVFSDHLTRALGVDWQRRPRGRDRNPAWEITGVPQSLVEGFSGRSRDINEVTDRLIEEYVANHGRRPRRSTIMKLRQQATLSSRPEKHIHSLADLTTTWRRRTAEVLDGDAVSWAREVTTNPARPMLRADDVPLDVPLDVIEELGRTVVAVVGEKRATWRRSNLYAETARQTLGWRFEQHLRTGLCRVIGLAPSAAAAAVLAEDELAALEADVALLVVVEPLRTASRSRGPVAATSGDEILRSISLLGCPRARPGRTPGHSESRDGPADGPLAGAELDRDLIEGHATLVEAVGALDLSLIQAEPAARTATIQMVGDGGSVDAVRLGQCNDALADLMPGDQFVDLGGVRRV